MMPEDPKPHATETETSTTNMNSTSNIITPNITTNSNLTSTSSSLLSSRTNLNMLGRNSISATTLPSVAHLKRKKKGHPKVITTGLEGDDFVPITGDLTKLALVEKAPSLQAFKKDFINSYEMVMGPGSRAKLTKMKREPKIKKEPEPILPKSRDLNNEFLLVGDLGRSVPTLITLVIYHITFYHVCTDSVRVPVLGPGAVGGGCGPLGSAMWARPRHPTAPAPSVSLQQSQTFTCRERGILPRQGGHAFRMIQEKGIRNRPKQENNQSELIFRSRDWLSANHYFLIRSVPGYYMVHRYNTQRIYTHGNGKYQSKQ
eukprot:sb/3466944/